MNNTVLRVGFVVGLAALAVTVGLIVASRGTEEVAAGAAAHTGGVTPAVYIKFEGLDGEAQDKVHLGWSNIRSFDQVITGPTAGSVGSTRTVARAVHDPLLVVKELDMASPKLAEACLKGEILPSVQIHVAKEIADGGQVTYYTYELKNVLISSYSVGGSSMPEGVPLESVTLNF